MASIFGSLREYAGKWSEKARRSFSIEEKAEVASATVVPSQFGSSVCFFMKAGGQKYIPLSNDSTAQVGQSINLDNAELVTLQKAGEADIVRVSVK